MQDYFNRFFRFVYIDIVDEVMADQTFGNLHTLICGGNVIL